MPRIFATATSLPQQKTPQPRKRSTSLKDLRSQTAAPPNQTSQTSQTPMPPAWLANQTKHLKPRLPIRIRTWATKVARGCVLGWLLAGNLAAADVARLRLAVASSVDNSGLAPLLRDGFTSHCSCVVDLISVGSAAALTLLSRGDVAAAITHAPELETDFLATYPGSSRTPFMHTSFVLAGPTHDPAAVRGLDLEAAFSRIATVQHAFVSRADHSGTHLAEQAIWQQLAPPLEPHGDWYRAAGNQMGATLLLAAQLDAYTLSETATLDFLRAKRGLTLQALAQDNPPRRNIYSVLLGGEPDKLAGELAAWLQSTQAKVIIAGYRVSDTAPFTPLP